MVSENFAREFWGDPAKAVGRRIRQTPKDPWREIIGVVGDEQQDGVTKAAPHDDLLADADERVLG